MNNVERSIIQSSNYNKENKIMSKLWSWLFPTKTEDGYLKQSDIERLGFKETLTKGTLMYFKKGNMSLKWDFHVTHRIVTIKWGKSMRFFGIVETADELDTIVFNIDEYFNNRNR